MAWQQLFITVPKQDVEPVAELLTTFGALSVSFLGLDEEAIHEPLPGETPLWDMTRVVGLFQQEADLLHISHQLHRTMNWVNQQNIRIEKLEDQQWERVWLQDFHSMRFGERIVVGPEPTQNLPEQIHIQLDPGLAFGTGGHPSTAMCLEWLDQAVLQGFKVIDYGCGSGILGIAAAKLGAQQVWAIDHDPQALQATQANALGNQVLDKFIISSPGDIKARPFPNGADLLVANILAGPLIELAPMFISLLRQNGQILLAGLLRDQALGVIAAYGPMMEMQTAAEHDGWISVVGKRVAN